MSHVRAQIRARAAVLLEGAWKVFVGLSWPSEDSALPCYMVIAPVEQVAVETLWPSRQVRRLQLKVYCRAAGSDEAALLDQLDAMAAYAEERLLVFGNWVDSGGGPLVQSVTLAGTVVRVEAVDAKKGEAELTFLVEYATVEAAPHVAA